MSGATILDPATGHVGIAVVHAQKRGDLPHQRVLVIVAAAIGQNDIPQGLDHADAVLVGDTVLDGAGEADRIGRIRLDALVGDAKSDRSHGGVEDGQSILTPPHR